MPWIAVHRPVQVDGQVILHRQDSASVIPAELESKMDAGAKASCIKVSDEAARRMFPELYAPAPAAKAPAAPAAEAK